MKQPKQDVYTENSQGYVVKFHEYANRVEYESNYKHKHNYWEFFLVTKGRVYHYMEFIEQNPYQHLDLYAIPHIFQSICDLIDPNLFPFF